MTTDHRPHGITRNQSSVVSDQWAAIGFTLSVVGLVFLIAGARAAVSAEVKDTHVPGPRAVVSLRAESTVPGPAIRLGEIADIQGTDPALAERLRSIEIGQAPLPGLRSALNLLSLKARLRLQEIDPSTLRWNVPSSLSVTTALARGGGTGGTAPAERAGANDRRAAEPLAAVSLRAESTLPGPAIRLGEVADIQGTDQALTDRLHGIEVGRAPLPGLSRTLDLPYIKARLRLEQIDPSSLTWDVPSRVSVTTASQRVTGEKLLAVVREHIQAGHSGDAVRLSIHPTTQPPDLVLPAGALELKARGRGAAEPTTVSSVMVEAWVDGALARAVSVPVRVSQLFEVLIAAQPVTRHALLGPEDVRLERRELSPGQDPLKDLGAIMGRRAVRNISAGELLQAGMLELPPLVRRGDIVLLIAQGRGLRAVAQGEAREEGKAGQVVRVRNLSSGREVYGQVEAEGAVRVSF